jgi:transposase
VSAFSKRAPDGVEEVFVLEVCLRSSLSRAGAEDGAMMGRQNAPEKLFYQFRLEDHVPSDHPLRQLDTALTFARARTVLAGHYSRKGRPSVDPELMLRMLLVGYAYGIRSERQLCNEVHLNLAYRWFCRLGLEGAVPDHSTFSKNRYGRFRESDVYRVLFEEVVDQCRQAGIVPGEGFAVDGSFVHVISLFRNGPIRYAEMAPL